MPHRVCIFEDKRFGNFYPLSLSQPVFDLRVGSGTLRSRLREACSAVPMTVICREYLAEITRIKTPDVAVNEPLDGKALFLNGRLLAMGDELRELLDALPDNALGVKGGYVVMARLDAEPAAELATYLARRIGDAVIDAQCDELASLAGTTRRPRVVRHDVTSAAQGDYEDAHLVGEDDVEEKLPVALEELIERHGLRVVAMDEARLVSFPWQLIECNGDVIRDDFQRMPLRGPSEEASIYPGVHLVGEDNMVIGDGAVIKPGAVIDASDGPVIIGDRTVVEPGAVVMGPVSIGADCIVRAGARILENTSTGNVCKVGGEIDATIVAGYSNKQHDGFIGHSYLGEWVNIGAASNNSDLKNNYSPVRMWNAGSIRPTGRQFMGVIMGDHTKTGINTLFNTGTVVGFNCNVYSSEMPAKFVPSFSWGHGEHMTEYDLERAMQTAQVVLERRRVRFGDAHRRIFERIHAMSQRARRNL